MTDSIMVSRNKIRFNEKLLGKSETRYRILFNNIPDAVFIFDQKTNYILDCNRIALER